MTIEAVKDVHTMYHVVDQFSVALVRSIPLKAITWLNNLGLYSEFGDGSVEISAGEIQLSICPPDETFEDAYGCITVLSDEGIQIDWNGSIFDDTLRNLRVSRRNLTDIVNHLPEFVEVERAFYDRLEQLQNDLEAASDPIRAMIDSGLDAVKNSERAEND